MVERAKPAPMDGRWLRRGFLALLALDVALIVARVALYPPLLAQSGAALYMVEPLTLLALYAGLALWTTRAPVAAVSRARGAVLRCGLIAGALWCVNLAVEQFTDLGPRATAPLLLAGFALWGTAGWLVARRTGALGLAVLAAIGAAMLCVVLTVTFGWLLTFGALPTLAHAMIGDPDFARSGWRDARAFAIANAFDAGFWHLLEGPLIAGVLGALGALLGRRGHTVARAV